ncbi:MULTISPECIES: type I polyketide synthase [unclassified Sulfitobacter]|uniref:type I polyketide synthase n=1 Tax=unclassified Sulfitobacter TaxID=196795 RepID=UPI0023E232A9|nr:MULTISPECIES: type I polyketide synthase [unclassified Sulfitobacter]MDF3382631.1 KR domain-containing protein [Sulfitobacter sp. Ks11]MDF3386050.1 KR domain-containing protein [Sulfitobacter sp. M85]MDF3389469.1 KR domain-containing protein [Sulfitobacter sp. Ks16]MDF3400106.1 KR domain-containing protein [Sulfitobacter sp. KE39]MDF3403527.1 KR domain-containing protein [Sulfitobacter sp. Ks35]
MNSTDNTLSRGDIAIVGMSVTVPGAEGIDAYWANLRDGVSALKRRDAAELRAAGESAERMARPNYVPVTADMPGYDMFDAEFFGFSPKDAAILDPQHRKFLEIAWEAMEQAGHMPESLSGPVGVYAGCGMGSYFYFNICSNPDLVDDVGMFLLRHTGNDKDFLSTRVSHVLDLKGPSINLQTACSTSLVAIHYAAQALRAGEIDMALAGGVTIELPQGRGYEFKENEILSPDGECHAFDHRAQGTVFGSGAGAVALRRLEDAVADGDHIWAVIKGSAVNNDGAAKAGYLAPSVDGQTAAIARALDDAGVAAQSIGMVECHGTGTYLGDPIEVAALTQAYRAETQAEDFCRIGSVKTNIGHLDTAAGVAGLAKAALSLHHQQIPPSLGYEAPNPAIPFEGSPFRVNDRLYDWPGQSTPRRAAVNALGVGGTNAHMILEEAPARAASEDSDFPFHVLCLSGRSKAALDANSAALAAHMRAHPEQPLADVAFTLKEGRRGFDKRRVLVAESHEEAAALLEAGNSRRVFTHDHLGPDPEVVFMFPGGGAQYADMARDLYETEPVFAEWMDRGLAHLTPQLDYDIRAIWLPEPEGRAAAEAKLKRPSVQLPLIMIVEYALAQLWLSWGVKPAAMVGHSMGENVAACLAGVMRFEDCIDLVLLRGRLFDEVPSDGMISIAAPLERITPLLGEALDIASVNGPELIAVSGPEDALEALQERLDAAGLDHQRIAIDIAAHSRMLDPILDRYRAFLATLDLRAPQMPFLSNRSGEVITAQMAMDPDYWVEQLRHTVNFADCINTLSRDAPRVFLEVGPGKALSALAQMHANVAPGQVMSSLRHPEQEIADDAYFLGVIGRLWACGAEADWAQIWGEARRNRVVLPTYQFQRARYFIAPGEAAARPAEKTLQRIDDIGDWGALPHWQPRYAERDLDLSGPLNWLVFSDTAGLGAEAAARLRAEGHRVVEVTAGDAFDCVSADHFTLAAEQGRSGYDQLIAALDADGQRPDRIAHFWLTDDQAAPRPGSSRFDRNVEQGFWSLTWLAQSLAEAENPGPLHLSVFTTGAALVAEEGLAYPEKALISGPVGAMAREVPELTAAQIDLPEAAPAAPSGWFAKPVAPAPVIDPADLIEELLATPANLQVAHRAGRRYELGYRAAALPEADLPGWKSQGTYLITGGFGGIGLTLAADILETPGTRVILLSRAALPMRHEWDSYLASHGPADATARRLRAVLRLEAKAAQSGGAVEVARADVANLAQMRRVIEDLTARHGGLTGVIHAAGVLDDAPLLAKTDADIDAVLAPKVQGLRVLDQLLPDGTLDLMVLFSSTSTATRAAGQVDYVAANAWLNAFAQSRRAAQTRVVAVNWGVWGDVGMAAESLGGGGAVALPARPIKAALLETAGSGESGAPEFTTEVAASHWLLAQHRTLDGRAIMPGTGYIELLAEAAAAQGLDGFTLQDLYFLRPLPLADGARRKIKITLTPEGKGFAAELHSACVVNGKPAWQLHVQARLSPADGSAEPLDLAAIAARCEDVAEAAPGRHLPAVQEAHLKFGPRWHVLQCTSLGQGEGIATLHLPEAAQADLTDGYLMHPGLMDIATGWAMALIPGYAARHLWVPLSYGEITLHAPLPAEVRSHVRLAEGTGAEGLARFDVTITDPQGTVLVKVRDFAMKRLEGAFADVPPPDAREVTFEDADSSGSLSPAEERLARLVRQGIRTQEGPEALRRALALEAPQVIVSSLPLQGLIAQADAPLTDAATQGQSFERPDLDGSFVAPRNGIEERLAEIWSNLLGVSPVGVEDSFFDLGGHSLIAVRLFAAVKREFKVEFPISVLFEAPTIAKCAALIAAERGDVAQAEAVETDAAGSQQRFDYLVPLNQSSRDATPLFVVAGMFGNVLNLRHLALPFSNERPVYGVQARGLIGDAAPHEEVQTAAADYITEIRALQPQGPYLLAGYSGGGITAYEMAQQLKAAGQEVAVLAMLDTPLPVRPSLSKIDKAHIKLAELRRKGPAYLLEWARNRWAWERERRRAPQETSGEGEGVSFNSLRIQAAFLRAVGRYETPQWDGPMTLFRPPLDRHWAVSDGQYVTAEKEYVYEDNQWRQYAPRLQVIEVPGDHVSMVLAPNVTVLAQELAEVIAAALPEGAGQDHTQATAAE